MKITDLRIGNYIRSKHSGQIIQVYKVDSSPNHVGNVNNHLIIDFEPLPIDTEMVKRLGGVENIYHPIPEMGKAKCFDIDINDKYLIRLFPHKQTCFLWDRNDYFDPERLFGVHQIQNIYHALTGEELVLKMH